MHTVVSHALRGADGDHKPKLLTPMVFSGMVKNNNGGNQNGGNREQRASMADRFDGKKFEWNRRIEINPYENPQSKPMFKNVSNFVDDPFIRPPICSLLIRERDFLFV